MQSITISPGKRVFFVSDVHLGVPDHASSLQREKILVEWLDRIAGEAAAIHLVGDLFDFWFEYKHAVPKGFVRILGKLAELRDRGIPIYSYTGNHDLWMFDYFETELGIPVFREPQTWIYNNQRFLVGHGDGIGPGDHGYKFIKRVFSNRLCQWLFARIHPNLGVGMALFWSRKSRLAEEGRDESFQGEQEPQVVYAREQLQHELYRYFVFGHRHCPTVYPLNEQSTFVNLGDWIRHFTYARFDGENIALENFQQTVEPSKVPSKIQVSGTLTVLLTFLLGVMAACSSPGVAQSSSPAVSEPAVVPVSADLLLPSTGLLYTLPGKYQDLTMDGLGNLFTLSPTGEIRRYSEQGKLLYQYSEVRLGRVGHIDASNPLRVLVYYPEFLTVVLLTNTLAISGEINLGSLGFNRVRAAGLARDGQTWLYDEANFQLVKIDERGQVIRRSEPLNYILGLELQPVYLCERNNQLFLHDTKNGILVFDAFGTYEFRFGGSGIRRMQAYAEQVVYQKADQFFYYDLKTYREGQLTMPDVPMMEWSLDSRRLALLNTDGISVYSLP